MSSILELSVRNREELCQNKMEDHILVTPTTVTHRLESYEKQETNKPEAFKKKKSFGEEQKIGRIADNDAKIKKNEDMPLLIKIKEQGSVLERTQNLKDYFLKSIKIQDEQIEKMMQFREVALKRKESDSLLRLHQRLESNELSHEAFIESLESLTA